VALKNYYELLEIPSNASADEVKRAFRQQIARYHPDKVQHLGKEFQNMAADRAAELTEAYRILSDEGRRAEYDRAVAEAGGQTSTVAAAPPPSSAGDTQPAPAPTGAPPPPPPPPREAGTPKGAQFTQERASRDEFVRKATIGRFRQALATVGGDYDDAQWRGFDIACVPKSKLFGRSKNPRLLGRFVSHLDREAVADAWTQASKWGDSKKDDVCVLLMGTSLAPAGELAGEIAEQRKKSRGAKLTLIPVDARVWDAHMPLDAPAIAKTLLARLKSGG
jgi:curved DNA-binding protein CbpA